MRQSISPILRSLSVLMVFLLIAWSYSLAFGMGTINRMDSFVIFILCCTLPTGAHFAGKHWHNGPVFLYYGALGSLALYVVVLDSHHAEIVLGTNPLLGLALGCTAFGVLSALLCNEAGRAAGLKPKDESDS